MSDTMLGGQAGTGQPAAAEPSLHRVMGPWLLLLFIVGDILGTGIYALTGQVANQVGGIVWLPFLVAFAVAMVTAFSYLELVTKYPQAAGAALYTHKAFGVHFITFIVAFAVMCSGITSASTASRAFAANMSNAFGLGLSGGVGITLIGLGFMAIVAIVNLRGVGESVKANVVLTCVELTGLLIIITIGMMAIAAGQGDVSRVMQFKTTADGGMFWPVIAATTLAFFAMVGFEDSVNMAEETKDPSRIFPKILLIGLFITGVIYVLVSISAITLVPPEQLGEGETPLLKVVQAGAPNFPIWIFGFITMFAVANSALINMLMASRLVYGMSREHVLPPILGKVHATRRTPYVAIGFTSLLAFALITFVGEVPALGGTTALLLLCVFTVVNIAVLVLRKDTVGHEHFRTPTFLPIIGALSCAFLAGPWTGRASVQYTIAGVLIGIGVLLWVVTVIVNRRTGTALSDPLMEDIGGRGPVN
ncbi:MULTISPECIES: APC family permease [Bosea]|jgi:APA family basic amino acid/polyamine antiporter|uniref:APC family permease n=1 Tax=Bosea TaxID=85413 RepID=UPI00214F7016|nr:MULTISPECIES: APC family permease [Bosea]MCR4522583.1 APC family permease [Bosea sp. 47.2.35]MDR6827089.1 amino acid transporter [Bosea robiniae]MDR6893799.1 amino acid transporter [Bosea sp. BE109]MDR7136501.1 amino acid transporter [Bosea sp. BE168]MDR7173200.1 amino acid transporter [Bosea sp. BE271]